MSEWFERIIQRKPAPLPENADRDSLLAAVIAAPDDDGPRMVYADWLMERGDPRGEFIAIQCTLPRLDDDDPRIAALEEREALLLKKHKKNWVGRFKGPRREYGTVGGKSWAAASPTMWTFARGFADTVSMSLATFMNNAPELLSNEPVRSVHLRSASAGEGLRGLVESCPHLERIRRLDLSRSQLEDDDLAALLTSSRFSGLTAMNFRLCRLGVGRAVRAFDIADSTGFPALRELDLTDNAIGDRGVAALANSRFVSDLAVIRLGQNKLRHKGAQPLPNRGTSVRSHSCGCVPMRFRLRSRRFLRSDSAIGLSFNRATSAIGNGRCWVRSWRPSAQSSVCSSSRPPASSRPTPKVALAPPTASVPRASSAARRTCASARGLSRIPCLRRVPMKSSTKTRPTSTAVAHAIRARWGRDAQLTPTASRAPATKQRVSPSPVALSSLSSRATHRKRPESTKMTVSGDRFDAYCDFDAAGGWTLLALMTTGGDSFLYDSILWTTGALLNESSLQPNTTAPGHRGKA